MAPAREKNLAPEAVSSPRKTRSVTSGKRVAPPAAPPKARSKKAKLAAEKGKAKEPAGPKGKGAEPAIAKGGAKGSNDAALPLAPADGSSKAIIIEACKQCSSFKKRAEKVKDGLESAVTGIAVVVNPDKPRRGCFEIRESSGEVFVSLLDMPRPFTRMKNLDMDQVIADIIKKMT